MLLITRPLLNGAGFFKKIMKKPKPNDAFWINAAKQVPWPVDLKERHISVPESELAEAQDHLMVRYLCSNGFFIQLCIEVIKTTVFDPFIEHKLPAKRIAPDDALFHVGDQFRVNSTGCEMDITILEANKIELKYTNRPGKNGIVTNELQLQRGLNMGTLIKI